MSDDQALPHVAHRREPERDRAVAAHSVGAVAGHRHEVAHRHVDVGHEHRDAHLPALVEVDRGLVEVGLDAGQQGGEVLHRVVRLEVGRLVGDEPVAVAVALVERVVRERLDDVEQRGADGFAVARRLRAFDELLPLLLDERTVLLPAVVHEEVLDDRVGPLRIAHAEVEALPLADLLDRDHRVPHQVTGAQILEPFRVEEAVEGVRVEHLTSGVAPGVDPERALGASGHRDPPIEFLRRGIVRGSRCSWRWPSHRATRLPIARPSHA